MRFLQREQRPGVTEGEASQVQRVRSVFTRSNRVLVLTGAGISVAAGLPVYRGPGGLYGDDGSEIPEFMHAHALPESLGDQWQFWGPLRETTRLAEPTAGHLALAEWQQRRVREGAEVTLVTANVDNLHERAGSDPVHHIHGRLGSSVCMVPDCSGRLDDDRHSDGTPTPCPECGAPMRLGAVLFGEQVDVDAQWAAKRAVRSCDAFLAVGTSGSVSPVSGLLRYANDVGALTVLVNPAPGVGRGFDEHLRMTADAALPLILAPA